MSMTRDDTRDKTPLFSLILATVGRTDELDRMFVSLAAQTLHDFEVVVVDQNADDRLKPHLDRARSLGIALRHIRLTPPNLAAARNAGIAAATGRYVGFPDDDCWYDCDLLEALARRFQRADQPGGVIARWVEQDEQPASAADLSWKRSSAFRDIPVCSITLFCSLELCLKLEGFDPRLGVGQWFGAAEETDFAFRALREGALFTYEPLARVHHAVASAQPQVTLGMRNALRHRARGTGALYAKHRLPFWVVARGLVAPVVRPLLKGSLGADLLAGWQITLGRLDGMLHWRRKH
ncbi:glycosyltransferase family 2 protein [Noviherbaspirillum galbum]|uniref:Glycosyltransferase n=1 Tax=Noviherbaspirillum galbum TaxID=2709383 RepID=A0A6B3SWH1_9BURK|nr:glycosyltransferase family 2 protein [Noviherbaspirillum galbum]NEX62732.1 glycosyltransferase [Noviherbaspirillum galbum]